MRREREAGFGLALAGGGRLGVWRRARTSTDDDGLTLAVLLGAAARWGARADGSKVDLAAVNRLDEVRTADLTQSRENLWLIAQEPDHGLRPY